jgi:hypothetical protein
MSIWQKCALLWLGGIASPMLAPVQLEPLSAAEHRMPDREAPPPAADSGEADVAGMSPRADTLERV